MRVPPRLASGSRVALVAPAGPLRDESELARAIDNARSFGWEPVAGENVLRRHGYFAGTDEQRAHDVNAALRDDSIDAIWCVRGGYGAMRILPALDYDALSRRPRVLIGYSDITAMHAAIGLRANLVSYHGPTARHTITPFSRASMQRALIDGADSCGTAAGATIIRPGRAEGHLAGGNLSLLAATIGTPWMPSLDGAILVLEDVGEAVYRIDRMLRQLLLSGAVRGVRAVAFGHCTDCPETADDGARTLEAVVREFADALNVPCLLGIPVGHINDQWTLPLGAPAALDADSRALLSLST